MPAQFGSTPIGGMQFNGVTIGAAMMNGVTVYKSSLYPLNETWGPVVTAAWVTAIAATHTIAEAGTFSLSATMTSGVQGYTFKRNGTSLGSSAVTATLSVGDVVTLTVGGLGAGTHAGTWSIVKN